MRKTNQQHLGEIIKEVLKNLKIEDKVLESKISDVWETEMGMHIARYTEKINFRDGSLTVYLTSPVLKQELSFGKDKIMKILNDALGSEEVKNLVFK